MTRHFERDWKKFPELRNSEFTELYFQSPHKQIVRDFRAECIKVIDGDTIRLRWEHRDFDFPLRLLDIDAPELNEGGQESQEWLEDKILHKEVWIKINPKNRVGKYGRLLGKVLFRGLDMGDLEIQRGFAKPFDQRDEGKVTNINKILRRKNWF